MTRKGVRLPPRKPADGFSVPVRYLDAKTTHGRAGLRGRQHIAPRVGWRCGRAATRFPTMAANPKHPPGPPMTLANIRCLVGTAVALLLSVVFALADPVGTY